MKRFFCSICRKVKRTQQWPAQVENVTSINVYDRVGECNFHTVGNRTPIRHRNTYARVVKSVTGKPQARKRA